MRLARKSLPILDHSLSGRLALSVAVVLLGAGPALQRASAGAEDLAELGAGIVLSQLSVEPGSQVARLVRLLPDGSLRILSEGFHSARDPDVSFDGKRILFSGKKRATSRWQISLPTTTRTLLAARTTPTLRTVPSGPAARNSIVLLIVI